jgi:hypothetical protein
MDSGDLGGVSCVIESGDKEGRIVMSLIYLRVASGHPLKARIKAYQRARVRNLSRQK